MAEWSIAAVLKTADPQGSGGSNPSLSASFCPHSARITSLSTAIECRRLQSGKSLFDGVVGEVVGIGGLGAGQLGGGIGKTPNVC